MLDPVYDEKHTLRNAGREIGLVEAVASREDSGRGRLADKEVDDVEEPIDAILVVVANRDERHRHLGCYTDRVLDVEVLDDQTMVSVKWTPSENTGTYSLDTSLAAALRVAAAIERLKSEGRGRRDIGAEAGEEALKKPASVPAGPNRSNDCGPSDQPGWRTDQ